MTHVVCPFLLFINIEMSQKETVCIHYFCFTYFCVVLDKVLLGSPGWSQTRNPTSASCDVHMPSCPSAFRSSFVMAHIQMMEKRGQETLCLCTDSCAC